MVGFYYLKGADFLLIDFAQLNLKERPMLILRNVNGEAIQSLGYAKNISLKANYNEISELHFEIPKKVEGKITPKYFDVKGRKIVELKDIGQFIVVDPKETTQGFRATKSQTAYSLEWEFVDKNLSLENSTYNLWNPITPDETIIGIILEKMPSWSLGYISPTLIDKYRTFEENEVNIYNFMKSTVQKTYGCIFEFDTLHRVFSVRDINRDVVKKPVFLSPKNLIKEIDINEDTQNIRTVLEVSGAEGVNIRAVNPTGTNKLYNLDYFMNKNDMPQDIIEKWGAWKTNYENSKLTYSDLDMSEALQLARLDTENAKLSELEHELKMLEDIQASRANEMAQYNIPENEQKLQEATKDVNDKKIEIQTQEALIENIEKEIEDIGVEITSINNLLKFTNYFNDEEFKIISRVFFDESIQENSFVQPNVGSFIDTDAGNRIDGLSFDISDSTITKILDSKTKAKDLYSIKGGKIICENEDINLEAEIIRGNFERQEDDNFIGSFYLNGGEIFENEFGSASLSMTGISLSVVDDTKPNSETPNAIAEGSTLSFSVNDGFMFFTQNTTSYQQRAVEWELLEYGEEIMRKISHPVYSFSLSPANFLALEEFKAFKYNLMLGESCYIQTDEGKAYTPICVSVVINFENLSQFRMEFGNRFSSNSATFKLADILEESISMGKTVNYSKYNYNQWVNSGAKTEMQEFMDNALDVAKKEVLSSTGQAISWDQNGLRMRKWNDKRTGYEPEQIWGINNRLVFTRNNWDTAEMAVGKINDPKLGELYGVCAPALVGNVIAGNSLTIESSKKDGDGNSVVQIDGNGSKFVDTTIDIYDRNKHHITLNPHHGFAMGQYPLYSDDNVLNDKNVTFKAGIDGNVYAKGVIQATDFLDPKGNSMLANKNGSSPDDGYQIMPDYLKLKGLDIYNSSGKNTFSIDENGNVTMNGKLTLGAGSSINWNYVNSDPKTEEALDNVEDLATGEYIPKKNTFISGNKIYSPLIQWAGDNGAALGSLTKTTGDDGTGNDTQLIKIHSNYGAVIEAQNGGLRLQASNGIWIPSNTSLHLQGLSGDKNVANRIRSIENRLSALENK